jgi:hypothetical protein
MAGHVQSAFHVSEKAQFFSVFDTTLHAGLPASDLARYRTPFMHVGGLA